MPKQAKDPVARVTENDDGSAMVELPDDLETGFENGGTGEEGHQQQATGDHPDDNDDPDRGTTPGDDDEDDEDEHASGDGGQQHAQGRTAEEQEAIREKRRKERADRKKRDQERWTNLHRQLDQQKAVIEDLLTRQSQTERRATGSDLAQIDTALAAATANIERLKSAIAQGTAKSDGRMVAEATARMHQEMRQQESLTNARTALINQQRAPATQQGGPNGRPQQNQQFQPDPRMVQLAQTWLSRNSWYNPAIVSQDDRVAHALDQQVSEEGFDPATQEYWVELDRRISKVLPHRKGGNMGGTRDGKPSNRRVPVNGGSQTTGAGGAGNSGRNFTISAERVKGLKDAGLWDDPKARASAIEEMRKYDREHASDKQR